jgi:hypothetical protein
MFLTEINIFITDLVMTALIYLYFLSSRPLMTKLNTKNKHTLQVQKIYFNILFISFYCICKGHNNNGESKVQVQSKSKYKMCNSNMLLLHIFLLFDMVVLLQSHPTLSILWSDQVNNKILCPVRRENKYF